jgi:amino acid permease
VETLKFKILLKLSLVMKKFVFALFLMVSTVAGAAILGFPYLFSQVGFWTGLACLALVLAAGTLMTLYIAETTLRTKETFHLSGFAKKYLGKNWHFGVLALEVLALYTAIGISLTDLFGGNPLIWGTIFFIAASPLIFLGVTRFDKSEALVSASKILLLIVLMALFFPTVNQTNLQGFDASKVLVPFGLILFASLGYTVIPQLEDIFKKDLKKIMPVVIVGMLLVLVLYSIFSYIFVGNFGTAVNEIATVGLSQFKGWGNFYVLLATATPFIALSIAVRNVYVKDAGMNKKLSWFLASLIPFLVYVYVKLGFVNFLQIAGGIFGSGIGIVSGLLVLKAREKSRKKPAFVVPGGDILVYIMMAVFASGLIYTIYNFF